MDKVFSMDQTDYDVFFIAVKNRLKDYYRAANSISFLPSDQQASAKALVDRIDAFINNRLFDKVEEFLKKDIASANPGKRINAVDIEGHKIMIAKYFAVMDYCIFEYSEQNRKEKYFTDVTLMDIMAPEKVLQVLQKTVNEINKLSQCDRLEDIKHNFYYKNVNETLRSVTDCKIDLHDFDYDKQTFAATFTAKDESQAKGIMSFFEKNWEKKAEDYFDSTCFIVGDNGTVFEGEPKLEVVLCYDPEGINGERGFVPVSMKVYPADGLEGFGAQIGKEDVPMEFFEKINSDDTKKWLMEGIDRHKQKNKNHNGRNDI